MKVASVELCGYEDVYVGTVDEYHNYLGCGQNDTPEDVKCVKMMQCAEALLASQESCVAENTQLMTKAGITSIKDAVKRKIEVWNGNKWSEVMPVETGKNRSLYRVWMSDGSYLDCTGNHKFLFNYSFCESEAPLKIELDTIIEQQENNKKNWFQTLSKNILDSYHADLGSHVGVTCGPMTNESIREAEDAHDYGIVLKRTLKLASTGHRYVSDQNTSKICSGYTSLSRYRTSVINRIAFKDKHEDIDTMFSADAKSLDIFLNALSSTSRMNQFLRGAKRVVMAGWNIKLAMRIHMLFRKSGSFAIIKKYKENYFIHEVSEEYYRSNGCSISKIVPLDGKHTVYCFTEKETGCAMFGGTFTAQCNLAEIFLNNLEDVEEFWECSKLLYKLQKQIAAHEYLFPETNAIVHKNMRLGLGVTGVCQVMDKFEPWCDDVYRRLREFDKEYSAEHGWPRSIRLSVVKPSGSLSLLSGSTPGGHPGYSNHHVRRVRFASNDPLINHLRKAGYPVEYEIGFSGKENHDIVIVSFPAAFDEGTVLSKDMNAIEQLELVKRLNTCWADQAVSVTVYYKKEELEGIQKWLEDNYDDGIKTVSFLLHSEHGFRQAPLEEITAERYEQMRSRIRPIGNVNDTSGDDDFRLLGLDECAGGSCPIK